MEAPEFMKPEDGYEQLSMRAPFGDERGNLDIFYRKMSDAAEYAVFVDGVCMGELMYTDHWYTLKDCLLTSKEIAILTPIIEQSVIRPPEPTPVSDEEKRLREWLVAHDVHPNEPLMQSMIINSFYAEENEQYDDDDLIPLEDIDFDRYDLNQGFDHKADEDEEEEEQEWQTKIQYALDHLDNFVLYINAEWQ